MTYNYLGLVNQVCRAVNDDVLSESDFASAIGFHSYVKDVVNYAIEDIYQEEDGEWPFAHEVQTKVLTVPSALPYIIEYAVPSTIAKVDWESFRLKRTETPKQDEKSLCLMEWDEYHEGPRSSDANSTLGEFGVPDSVVRLQNDAWTVTTVPKEAYTVEYDAFKYPVRLSATTDVPAIPQQYEQLILNRALYYVYMFRDNIEQADRARKKSSEGVNRMRRHLIPQAFNMRSNYF